MGSSSRLREWWDAPEQSLLRGEVRWTLRWMSRPPGSIWILALLALDLLTTVSAASFESRGGGGATGAWLLKYGVPLLYAVFYLGIWILLIQRRAHGPFSPGRIHDLLLTPVDRRFLWPALLTAPILLSATVTLLDLAISAALFVFFGAGQFLAAYLPQETVYSRSLGFPWMATLALLWTVEGFVVGMALTAYATLRTLPSGGAFRILVHMFLGGLAIVAGNLLFAFLPFRAGPGSSISLAGIALRVFGPHALGLALAIWIWKASVRGLRGDKLWGKLQRTAEKTP